MHLDAKSNHIVFISNFYALRLFIDYRESTVQFNRRVPLFDPGIEFPPPDVYKTLFQILCFEISKMSDNPEGSYNI